MILKKDTIIELWHKIYHMQSNDEKRITHIHLVTGVDRDTIKQILEEEENECV